MHQFRKGAAARRQGFTLIELLIVIAIVLILIAIALPNFLEAQVRARVTKAKGEIRTYATALESYRLDWGGYPRDHDSIWPHPTAGNQNGYTQLTSPIKYLTALPTDPFGENVDTGNVEGGGVYRNRALYYEGGSGTDAAACGVYNNPALRKWKVAQCIHAYLTFSIGPDHNDSTNGNDDFPYDTVLGIYNPTNGTSSRGDIYRSVGEYKRARSTPITPGGGATYPGVRWETGTTVLPYSGEGE